MYLGDYSMNDYLEEIRWQQTIESRKRMNNYIGSNKQKRRAIKRKKRKG